MRLAVSTAGRVAIKAGALGRSFNRMRHAPHNRPSKQFTWQICLVATSERKAWPNNHKRTALKARKGHSRAWQVRELMMHSPCDHLPHQAEGTEERADESTKNHTIRLQQALSTRKRPGGIEEPPKQERHMRSSLLTLIVDDNTTNLRILEKTLKHHFSHIVDHDSLVKAENGCAALDAWRANEFDMILLDIDMPGGMDGVQVAQEIRKFDKEVIIIACTTSDSPSSRETYKSVGMDGCVRKPIDLRAMNDIMKASLAQREHLKVLDVCEKSFLSHSNSLPRCSLLPRPTYFDMRTKTAPNEDPLSVSQWTFQKEMIKRSTDFSRQAKGILAEDTESQTDVEDIFPMTPAQTSPDLDSITSRTHQRTYSSSSSNCACQLTGPKRVKIDRTTILGSTDSVPLETTRLAIDQQKSTAECETPLFILGELPIAG